MGIKIAVISDIHGHAEGLRCALKEIQLAGVDITVCLGDLLTYGLQPNEVIELLLNYQAQHRLEMIRGNHDQFYFDWQAGRSSLYEMADFVKESIEWTARALRYVPLAEVFEWRDAWCFESILFAHANPFAYGDWRYLDQSPLQQAAFEVLAQQQMQLGVFGHSHRQGLWLRQGEADTKHGLTWRLARAAEACALLNPGSVGQPRGCGFCYALLELDSAGISIELKPLAVDIKPMLAALRASDLSAPTQQKLMAYLRS
ncbi:MAG: metallophosphoesterase family protein [Thiomicrospira sp.]